MNLTLRSIRFSAEALGVSTFTIRRLIADGYIKSVNIGARKMIAETEIERIIQHGAGRRKLRGHDQSKASSL